MQRKLTRTVLATLLACGTGSAHAVLERVGPVSSDPAIGGYPLWYQDTTGIVLEFCDPRNQAEVAGGWCLLAPGEPPTVPEVFPDQFFEEHFYFAAETELNTPGGSRIRLVLALEAAFAAEQPIPGDQIVFSRIRVRMDDVPVTGTYRFIHPYGEEILQGIAGDRITFTQDIGINCAAGRFECAMNSRLGPFLLPSDTPGGPELPPVTGPVPGKLYIADPDRLGPVTGSPLPDFVDSTGALRNHNIFRVEGPPGSALSIDPGTGQPVDYIETTDFTLMGRLHTNSLPGRIEVSRASYIRDASSLTLDVYAKGYESVQSRLPGQPRPDPVMPILSFYDAPCAGVEDENGDIVPPFSAPPGATETPMARSGDDFWGQIRPATLPTAVCVKDAAARDPGGNVVPVYYPKIVTDEVTITQAWYDPSTRMLTVAAKSSDTVNPPTLTLAGFGDLVLNQITVQNLAAPPDKVQVFSSALGVNEYQVTTAEGIIPPILIPEAVADAFTFAEDAGPQTLNLLANDVNTTGATVYVTTQPQLGTATVNGNGTVTYTPNPDAFGTDSFVYLMVAGSLASNTANVTVELTPVNDPPIAVDDFFTTTVNSSVTLDILANDIDPDGADDIAGAVNVSTPEPAGATARFVRGALNFRATVPGTYTFTYQAYDTAELVSANTATVTVVVTEAAP